MEIRLYTFGEYEGIKNYGFTEAQSMEDADVIMLNDPTSNLMERVFKEKTWCTEVIVYIGTLANYVMDYDVKLIITGSMSEKERDFRIRGFIKDYADRLRSWTTNNFFNTAIDSMPSMVWLKRKDGVHNAVNSFFCKVVEKDRIDIEGKRHAYIWDVEEDDPNCIESENRAMTEGIQVEAIEEVSMRDGRKLRLNTIKTPIYDRRGKIYGTVGVGIDITQETALTDSLKRRNSSYETLFLTLGCGIICCDENGVALSANKAALQILGVESLQELKQGDFRFIYAGVYEEDREELMKGIQSLHKEGDSCSLKYRVKHKDGKTVYVVGDVKLLVVDGKYQYQRYLLDFTEWKESERRKQEFNRSVTAALGSDLSVIMYFSLNTGEGELVALHDDYTLGEDSMLNKKLCLNECINAFVDKYVHEEDAEYMLTEFSLQGVRDALSKKNIVSRNFRTKRGTWMKVKTVRFETDEGDYIVVGLSDVDEEVRKEKTRLLELQSALAAANSANETKSNFLSNMTHDIRTPMNAIVNYIRLASKNLNDRDKVASYIEKMNTSCNHLLELVNNTLDMSKLESGKIEINRVESSIPELIGHVTSIIEGMTQEKNIDFQCEFRDSVHEHVYCDDVRIHQVLINVLSNAIKYSRENGRVSLLVQELESNDNNCTYKFTVQDNGIGMSEDFLKRIFNSFERENNTTVSGIQGTGLGMAITKNLLELMHGTINVESEKGVGTKVSMVIPFEIDKRYETVVQVEELKDKRALIVSSDYSVISTMDSILNAIGMKVDWTMQPEEAKFRILHSQSNRDGSDYELYVLDIAKEQSKEAELINYINEKCIKDKHERYIVVTTDNIEMGIESINQIGQIDGLSYRPVYKSEFSRYLKQIVTNGLKVVHAEKKIDRILLVEDNEINREIAKELLSDFEGLIIDEAEDGREAFDIVKNSSDGYYSLILMDVQMPIMNGYDATLKIRNLQSKVNSSIPIYAMTANAFEEDRKKALMCGMNGHISKPIIVEELYKTITDVLYSNK